MKSTVAKTNAILTTPYLVAFCVIQGEDLNSLAYDNIIQCKILANKTRCIIPQ